MDSDSLEKIYTRHNNENRVKNYVVLEKERCSFFQKYIGRGKKILDLGCRDGALTRCYVEGNEVWGVDIDKQSLKRAEEELGIRAIHLDLNDEWDRIPNDYFDVVIGAEVIEHLFYPDVVLEKVYRALKPGGLFLGSIPHAFNLQNRIKLFFAHKKNTDFGDPLHINHFSYKEFRRLLEKYFTDIEIKPVVTKKFKLFAKIFPYIFAHTFIFKANKR